MMNFTLKLLEEFYDIGVKNGRHFVELSITDTENSIVREAKVTANVRQSFTNISHFKDQISSFHLTPISSKSDSQCSMEDIRSNF